MKHHYPDALWIDLLKPDVYRQYLAKPERIIELVHGNPDNKLIIVDKIQKVPELLSAIHHLIEEKEKRQFILTGSSARKLKRTGIDLLAGRVLLKTLHPFLLSELTDKPSLDYILRYGLLPVVKTAQVPDEVLQTYTTLYIREEVQAEGLVRNLGSFSRFLEAISFSHGSILNISNVARECEVERKTVEGYITILEDTLLAFRLPVFSKKARRALIAHPKFYFFDAGVFSSLRPRGPLDQPEAIGGAALEGLIAQHLRAWNAYSTNPYMLYFWRSRGGTEVDFVLYGEKELVAIEVKNSSRIRPEDLRSLSEFQYDYPDAKLLLLYRGKEKLLKGNIWCLPCETFLRNLIPNNPLMHSSTI